MVCYTEWVTTEFFRGAIALLATLLLAIIVSLVWTACSRTIDGKIQATWWLTARGKPVRWHEVSLPVPVLVEATVPPKLLEQIARQVRRVNTLVGRKILSEDLALGDGTWTEGSIVIRQGGLPDRKLGLCHVDHVGGHGPEWIDQALIQLGPGVAEAVVLHELLHAVGVGHARGRECHKALMCKNYYSGCKVFRGTKKHLRHVYRSCKD